MNNKVDPEASHVAIKSDLMRGQDFHQHVGCFCPESSEEITPGLG